MCDLPPHVVVMRFFGASVYAFRTVIHSQLRPH